MPFDFAQAFRPCWRCGLVFAADFPIIPTHNPVPGLIPTDARRFAERRSAGAHDAVTARKSIPMSLGLLGTKIGMTQAVATAEQHVGGKASHVEYEQHKGQWVYGVEVVKDQKVMDVTVDPMSGKILASVEDKNDHDDGHDRA